jgi:hypothetical protein
MQRHGTRPVSRWFVAAALTGLLFVTAAPDVRAAQDDTFELETVLTEASDFFGETTHGLATVIEKVFAELGEPNGFIKGEEVSGAFVFGLRYGRGTFHRKNDETVEIFWQGPSVGYDFGGNASRAFVLVYDLERLEQLFQRYPGVDGSFYFVAGLGVNYQRRGDVTLAPIRTGVGLRAGANIGYLHMTAEHSWIPF